MSDDQTEPTISFVQHELPPLEAGEYRLIVEQKIKNAATQTTIAEQAQQEYRFAICTERFQLHPNQVVKVFPPEDSRGAYAQALPHVMLSRTTLPWERSPYDSPAHDPAQHNGDSLDKDVTPWLAVLLFDQNDPPPTAMTASSGPAGHTSVRDLLHDDVHPENSRPDSAPPANPRGALPPNTLSYFQPEPWEDLLDCSETPDDPCQVIDIPVTLWKRVAPTRQDLPWLAHARTIKYGPSEQAYALVIGNRLPAAGHTSTAYLVSLEGMGAYLPDSGDPDGPPGLDQFDYIRLVSLKSWQFTTDPSGESRNQFATLLQNLTGAPDPDGRVDGLLRRPLPGLAVTGPHAEYVLDMLAQGYTALPYQTRAGQSTVTWYRGPLVPGHPPDEYKLPFESADNLIYRDPERNIYNTSYGAAWQLGRLLALADRNYAVGLYRWKLSLIQNTVQAAVKSAGINQRQRMAYYQQVTSILQDPGQIAQQNLKAPELRADLCAWLADLFILRGVPFWYLVPDESMLPPESLRFFLVDTQWAACLIDGAMSIGRATVSAWKHDQAFAPQWFEQISRAVQAETDESELPRLLSGFLLRSQAVKGWWPGIQVEGYDCNQHKLRLVRLDRLSDATLLALFDGEIAQVSIHEPLEGIHFGCDQSPPLNERRAAGVVDIQSLTGGSAEQASLPFTAADFARQRVASAQQVRFTLQRGS